jgi:hypothetical protein
MKRSEGGSPIKLNKTKDNRKKDDTLLNEIDMKKIKQFISLHWKVNKPEQMTENKEIITSLNNLQAHKKSV